MLPVSVAWAEEEKPARRPRRKVPSAAAAPSRVHLRQPAAAAAAAPPAPMRPLTIEISPTTLFAILVVGVMLAMLFSLNARLARLSHAVALLAAASSSSPPRL